MASAWVRATAGKIAWSAIRARPGASWLSSSVNRRGVQVSAHLGLYISCFMICIQATNVFSSDNSMQVFNTINRVA